MAKLQTLTKTKLSTQQAIIAGIAITCAIAVMGAFGASGLNGFYRYSRHHRHHRIGNYSPVRLDLVQDKSVMPTSITANSETPILKFSTNFSSRNNSSAFNDSITWRSGRIRLYFKKGASSILGKATFKLVDSNGNVLSSVTPRNKTVFFGRINKTIKNGDSFSVVMVTNSDIGEAEFTARMYGSYLTLSDTNNKPLRYRYGLIRTGYIKTETINAPLVISVEKGENMKIMPGDRNVKVATVNLNATGSKVRGEIQISEVQLALETKGMSPDKIVQIKVFDGNTEVLLSNDPSPTSSTQDDRQIITLVFQKPLIVIGGQSKKLDIMVDVSGSARGSFRFVVGADCITKIKSSAFSLESSGPMGMISLDNAKLSIARTDNYHNRWLNGNTDGVNVGKFQLSAENGDIYVESIYVNLNSYNGGNGDELESLYLYDGATLVATATLTGSNQSAVLFDMESDPYVVEMNATKELTIKVDTAVIANDGTATNATAVEGFQPVIYSGSITAKCNGRRVDVDGSNIIFSKYGLVKSQPMITIASTGDNLTYSGEYDLIDITVTADSNGPIGLYKMSFVVVTSSVDASDFRMYEGGTLVASSDSINVKRLDHPNTLVEVYFDKGGLDRNLRQIYAGTSRTYTLKADIRTYGNSGAVSTSMLGDAEIASTSYNMTAKDVDRGEHNNFIWSDLSYSNTSTSATMTAEWLNGFMLDSSGGFLPNTSSAISI